MVSWHFASVSTFCSILLFNGIATVFCSTRCTFRESRRGHQMIFSARSSFFHAGFTKIFTETVFSFLHDLFVRNERNISTQEGWLSKGSRKTTFFAHDDKTQIASRSV